MSDGLRGMVEVKYYDSLGMVFPSGVAYQDRYIGLSERPMPKNVQTLYLELLDKMYVSWQKFCWTEAEL